MRKPFLVLFVFFAFLALPPSSGAWEFNFPATWETTLTAAGSPFFRNNPLTRPFLDSVFSDDPHAALLATGLGSPPGTNGYSAPVSPSLGFDAQGQCRKTRTCMVSWGTKLTVRPEFKTAEGQARFKIAGIYSIGRQGANFSELRRERSGAGFPGTPPFDRYYRSAGTTDTSRESPSLGSWEQLWFALEPAEYFKLRVGTTGLDIGTGATVGRDDPKDIAAITIRHPEGLRFMIGTGAVPPNNRTNEDLARPIPFGPFLMAGYLGLYSTANAVYAAGYLAYGAACAYLKSLLAPKPESEPEPEWEWDWDCSWKKDEKGRSYVCESKPSTRKKFSPETRRSSNDSKCKTESKSDDKTKSTEDSKWPFSLLDLAHDYSVRLGDREPLHFLTADFDHQYGSIGAGVLYYPELNFVKRDEATGTANSTTDFALISLVHFKYNDGRVFANGEYATFGWDLYPAATSHGYQKGYHVFLQTGAHLASARTSVMFALASGRSLSETDPTAVHTPYPIHHQILEPYQWLLFETYGGGNRTFEGPPGKRHGNMSDAYAFAGRVDYAAAANLNLWGSYLWAHRLERDSTPFGQYGVNSGLASAQERCTFARCMGRALVAPPDNYGYVSDSFLGHELNLGADWKLSEALNISLRGAYWKPGGWFSEAYQAFGLAGDDWHSFQADPRRERRAIYGLMASFTVDF